MNVSSTTRRLDLYVEIEHGGGRNQFYEKFSVRQIIAHIMEFLWSLPDHRRLLVDREPCLRLLVACCCFSSLRVAACCQ